MVSNCPPQTDRPTTSYPLPSATLAPPTLPLKHHPRLAITRTSRLWSSHLKEEVQGIEEADSSLERLLKTIIKNNLRDCALIVIVDRSFLMSRILQTLLLLQNLKQVALLQFQDDLEHQVIWKSSRCQGVLFLLSTPERLLQFGSEGMAYWDYNARVVIAGLTSTDLEVFIQTKKAKKTEQIIGIVKSEINTGHYKIYMNELYWGRRGLPHITTWRGQSFTTSANLFPDKTSNLQRAVLNVITFEFPPSIMYRRSSNGTILLRFGWDVAVVKALSQVFNFTIDFIEPGPGELWGEKLANGTWSGMVGLLGRGEGDLGIANLYITALLGRREFQEFSTPFADDQSCVLARMDPPLPRWQSPGLPFQGLTWLVIFAGLLLSGPLLNVIARASTQIGPEHSGYLSLTRSSLSAYGVHFNHPIASLPHRTSTKVFVAFLWLYAIILITAYCSNLTAFLTVSRQPASIETFKELYGSNLRVLGLGPFFRNSMSQSGNQYLRALADRFFSRAHFEEVKIEVLAGKAVMINSKRNLEFVGAQVTTPQGKPMVRIMKECFSPYSVGIAYQSNSPLKMKFDRMITWMFESGLVRRWFLDSISLYQKFKNQDTKENQELADGAEVNQESGVIPLGTDHMQGVFILFAFGCLLSSILFTLEICVR